ncbi:MAG: YkgJ family cysteine cluster protein [Archangiaceae bacterium]|nr:YkgJ family cysteine cluster protein [Archangiaceae bacterium]
MLTRLTPTLRALLSQYQQNLPPEHYREFVEHIESLSAGFVRELEAVPAGVERARRVHQLMEGAMKDLGPDQPSCRAGCSACCHLEVEITREEGMVLAARVKKGHPIDRERLAQQAARERQGPEWQRKEQPSNRCVFLGQNGACTVYTDRPASCRKLLVISHPVECATADGKVQAITIPMAEVLLSTVISMPGVEFMSLSKGVSLALDAP